MCLGHQSQTRVTQETIAFFFLLLLIFNVIFVVLLSLFCYFCCYVTWGDTNQCLLTPGRILTTNQTMDTIKVQLGEPISFIGVTYKNMGEGFLTGAEVIQRQLHH